MTAVDDLAAWLTQIWDEDEEIARRAFQGPNEARYQDAGGPIRMNRWYSERVGQRVLRVQSGSPSTVPTKIVDLDPLLDRAIADHITRHDPAAELARIAADRKILKRCAEIADMSFIGLDLRPRDMSELAAVILADLALPHAGRPGYQEAWRPA